MALMLRHWLMLILLASTAYALQGNDIKWDGSNTNHVYSSNGNNLNSNADAPASPKKPKKPKKAHPPPKKGKKAPQPQPH